MQIYLDNAATTKPSETAIDMMNNCLHNIYGNPSSLHTLGVQAEKYMNEARKNIAAALVTDPSCITFTSGATESNNLATIGIAKTYGKRRKKIVTTTIEHPSVKEPINYLESIGFEVIRIPADNGKIDFEEIVNAVDENTVLVSCMLVNNENGYILPLKKAFMMIKRNFPETITHCDAVQAFMKIPVKPSELYADLISISAHKVNGIKGVGALYIKKGIRITPIIYGGGQEKGIRNGTESVPLIASFGATVSESIRNIMKNNEKAEGLKSYLISELLKLPEIKINSPEESSPYITNFSVMGIRSEIMLHFLESKGIFVSSGSACSKGAKSSVLKEFGINDKVADYAIRVSFSYSTTKEEIDKLIIAIKEGNASLIKSN